MKKFSLFSLFVAASVMAISGLTTNQVKNKESINASADEALVSHSYELIKGSVELMLVNASLNRHYVTFLFASSFGGDFDKSHTDMTGNVPVSKLNMWKDHILINGQSIGIYNNQTNRVYFNKRSDGRGSVQFDFAIDGSTANYITIKKGIQLPSIAYATGADTATWTKNDIITVAHDTHYPISFNGSTWTVGEPFYDKTGDFDYKTDCTIADTSVVGIKRLTQSGVTSYSYLSFGLSNHDCDFSQTKVVVQNDPGVVASGETNLLSNILIDGYNMLSFDKDRRNRLVFTTSACGLVVSYNPTTALPFSTITIKSGSLFPAISYVNPDATATCTTRGPRKFYKTTQDVTFVYVPCLDTFVKKLDYTASTAADCGDEFLKTIVASKIKYFDQCTTLGTDGGTPVYVKSQKESSTVDGLYFSRLNTNWTGDGDNTNNFNFAEFRFPVSGNIASLSFSYKTNNLGTATCPAADTKINGMNAYLEIKTADGGYGNATAETYNATVNDGQWHDVTIQLGGVGAQNILFKFYKFVGELIISNISIKTVAEVGNELSVSKMALGIQMDAQVDGSGNITAVNSSKTVMRFGVDLDIFDVFDNEVLEDIILSSGHAYGIADYGIQVNSKRYSLYEDETYWHFDLDDNLSYITINLGDIMNSKAKLETEFTVSAYVEVKTGESTSTFSNYKAATYSVKGMVNYYVDNASTLGITGETLANLQKIQAWIASVCA